MKIKWMWNGIKVDGKLHTASYSKGILRSESQESITLYAKNYSDRLPRIDGLTVENNSESMTDYFETDSARIGQDSIYWNEALTAYIKQEVHYKTQMDKRMTKCQKLHAEAAR